MLIKYNPNFYQRKQISPLYSLLCEDIDVLCTGSSKGLYYIQVEIATKKTGEQTELPPVVLTSL